MSTDKFLVATKSHLLSNLWLASILVTSWLLFWVFQPEICAVTVRLAGLLLMYGWDIMSVDDGKTFMLPTRHLSFGSACAGLGVVLAVLSAGACFSVRLMAPRLKNTAGLLLLPAAVVGQSIRIVFSAF